MKPARAGQLTVSVLARYRMLERMLAGDKSVPQAFRASCQSQAEFAELSLLASEVQKHALNTLKSAADVLIEQGGWRRMDKMRRDCRKLEKNAGKERGRAKRNASTEADALVIERRGRIRLEVAYVELFKKLATIAKNDPDLDSFLQRHQAGFSIDRVKLVGGDGHGD